MKKYSHGQADQTLSLLQLRCVHHRYNFPLQKLTLGLRKVCFVCEALNKETADLDGHADCSRCGPTVKLDWKNTPHILEHMSAHTLHDTTLNSSEEQCGLCLCPAPMCQIYLTKGCGTAGKASMDQSKSKCPNLACFNYKNTAQSLKCSPCSNVPVVCMLYPPGSPAVCTYSLQSHYEGCHCLFSPQYFPTCVELSRSEKDGMECLWNAHFDLQGTYCTKKRKLGNNPPLSIPEAHRLRLLVR